MFNGEKNVTNNNGCAAFIPHFGGVISAGYPVRNKDANIKDIKYVKLGLIMV